jgi:hypothetical protein
MSEKIIDALLVLVIVVLGAIVLTGCVPPDGAREESISPVCYDVYPTVGRVCVFSLPNGLLCVANDGSSSNGGLSCVWPGS